MVADTTALQLSTRRQNIEIALDGSAHLCNLVQEQRVTFKFTTGIRAWLTGGFNRFKQNFPAVFGQVTVTCQFSCELNPQA